MKPSLLLTAFVALLVLSSCASNATIRQRRIEANPSTFQALSVEDQALVAEGSIREGFSKESVFLSWGRPDDIRRGSKKGVPYETWIYTGTQAHTQSVIGMGYGYGGGYYPYHSRYYHDPFFGFYPSVAITQHRVRVGEVEFLNDRVVSWETRR